MATPMQSTAFSDLLDPRFTRIFNEEKDQVPSMIGDRFLFANLRPGRTILGQLGTDLTTLDASATLSGETNAILTVELILLDLAGEGTTNSYGLIHFGDHLMLSSAP